MHAFHILRTCAALSFAVAPMSAIAQDTMQDDRIRLETSNSASSGSTYVRKDSDTVAIREGVPQSGNIGQHDEAPGIASDGEALGMLMAINDHEIGIADLAQRKSIPPSLRDFTGDVAREHRNNQSKTRYVAGQSGINPYDSDDVRLVRERAATELAMLRSLDGAAFERALLDAMIQLNRDAVIVVDDVLLAASRNETVQGHLRKTRERFSDNLGRALVLDGQAQAGR